MFFCTTQGFYNRCSQTSAPPSTVGPPTIALYLCVTSSTEASDPWVVVDLVRYEWLPYSMGGRERCLVFLIWYLLET